MPRYRYRLKVYVKYAGRRVAIDEKVIELKRLPRRLVYPKRNRHGDEYLIVLEPLG